MDANDAPAPGVVVQIILNAMEPLPAVHLESSSDSSDSSSGSDGDSDMGDDDDQMVNVIYHVGGPADADLLSPFMRYLMHGRPRQRVTTYLDTIHQMSNQEFRAAFRLRRLLAYNMIDQLDASGFIPAHDFGKTKKSAELSFLMFLWYIGNEEPLRILGELFDMSESSLFRIICRIVDWLLTLLNEIVKWPEQNAIIGVSAGFAAVRGIRKCIGAVDVCHVPIIKPCVPNSIEYYNNKKFHSINLAAVVTSKRKFTMVYCGDPGSFHNTLVFRHSAFYQRALARPDEIFPHNTFLIGDGGYTGVSDRWLVHPFRDNGHLTPNHREFNRLLSSTRVYVEQAFGILKGRFRRLLNRIPLMDLPFIVDLIISCCILHNMCIDDNHDGYDYYDPNWKQNQPRAQPEAGDEGAQASRREQLFREIFPDGNYPLGR